VIGLRARSARGNALLSRSGKKIERLMVGILADK
jgi:hypothetical protein